MVLKAGRPTLLVIDSVDAVLCRSYADDFFGALRAWMAKASDSPWDSLRLLMACSTTPAHMIHNPAQSPFNIVPAVELSPLTSDELVQLARLHGLDLALPDLERLHRLTGGHPYLARRALLEATAAEGSNALQLDPQSQVYQAHLASLLHFVQREKLGEVLKAVLSNPGALVAPAQEALLTRAGLVYRGVAGLEPTCTLYRDCFTRTWGL